MARVLIVDDDTLAAEIAQAAVTAFGYAADVAYDGRQALDAIRSGRYQMVISDWEMPGISGIELCREVRKRQSSHYIYFVLLTTRNGTQNIVEGLRSGADDFVTKPFQPDELCVRLSVGERILGLESRDLVIFSLAKLAESRDPDTGAHLDRMREYSRLLAEQLAKHPHYQGEIDGQFIQLIYMTSPLHDIGKVGIPDTILLKPGKLTHDEFEVMKTHVKIGGTTLDAAARSCGKADYLGIASEIAWYHHERFDGTGYPHGLAGTDIPLSGRIVALADVYDALRSKRTYKEAFDHETVRSILLEDRGTHFDPDVVDAFLAIEDRFLDISERLSDTEENASAGNADFLIGAAEAKPE